MRFLVVAPELASTPALEGAMLPLKQVSDLRKSVPAVSSIANGATAIRTHLAG
jgi:hypothetical protein